MPLYSRIIPRPASFIDREIEIRNLLYDINNVRRTSDNVHARTIAGPTGSGKSRLLEEMVDKIGRLENVDVHSFELGNEPAPNLEFTLLNWFASILEIEIPSPIYTTLNAISIINRENNECRHLNTSNADNDRYRLNSLTLASHITIRERMGNVWPRDRRLFDVGHEDIHFDFNEDWLVCLFFNGLLDEVEYWPVRRLIENIIDRLNTEGLSPNLIEFLDSPDFLNGQHLSTNPSTTPFGVSRGIPSIYNSLDYRITDKLITELIDRELEGVIVFLIDDIHLSSILDIRILNSVIEKLEEESIPIFFIVASCDNSLFHVFNEYLDDSKKTINSMLDNRRKINLTPFDKDSVIKFYQTFIDFISQKESDDDEELGLRMFTMIHMPEPNCFSQKLIGSKRFPCCIWCAVERHLYRINGIDYTSFFEQPFLTRRIDCIDCET